MPDNKRVSYVPEIKDPAASAVIIRAGIARILGSDGLTQAVNDVLAKLEANDRATIRMFLDDDGFVDESEVRRFAGLHRTRTDAFVIDVPSRRPIEL